MENIFCVVKSKLTNFGPRSAPRPPLPNTSVLVGVAKAERFQYFRISFGPLLGLPISSQLSCSKLALSTAETLAFRQESANPDRPTAIPPICQPPNSLSAVPDK